MLVDDSTPPIPAAVPAVIDTGTGAAAALCAACTPGVDQAIGVRLIALLAASVGAPALISDAGHPPPPLPPPPLLPILLTAGAICAAISSATSRNPYMDATSAAVKPFESVAVMLAP